jgi:flagellar basal body-associated protein FliL
MKLNDNISKYIQNRLKQEALSLCSIFFFLFSVMSFAQVKTSIDRDSIKIGEAIKLTVEVVADTTDFVTFPEKSTFAPLEVIESFPIDTNKIEARYNLIKQYALTQFDSGYYPIPKQKIVIGDKVFFTDSLNVAVNNVAVDTIEQPLYDIKPYKDVEKSVSKWWLYLLIILAILGVVGFLVYWFVWRPKPLSEAEKIALLPPYDRAKLGIKKLEETNLLSEDTIKEYYSELTLVLRQYLEEKVYDRALESTTDELIQRLKIIRDGNQLELSESTIKNIESVFKRADLVKFAKSRPDLELAKMDYKTIDKEIDQVSEVLPEPSEEEKLLDEQYRIEQARKKRNRKIWITVIIGVFLLLATATGFTIHYGVTYVKDTILGNDSLELLETEHWVTSDYGVPPITISTPKVLKRTDFEFPEEVKATITDSQVFSYGSILGNFYVNVISMNVKKEVEFNLEAAVNGIMVQFEAQGAQNIFTKDDEIVTPNGAKGIDLHGTMTMPDNENERQVPIAFSILNFYNQGTYQQVQIIHADNDPYADQITERIKASIELIKKE